MGERKESFSVVHPGRCYVWQIPASKVELNASSSALNYPQRLYPVIAENLQYGEDLVGLRAIAMQWLSEAEASQRLIAAAGTPAVADLAWPIRSLHWRYQNGDRVAFDDHGDWSTLLGADLRWADYGYKREQALARLASLAMLVRQVGIGGMVTVLDEAETIDQLSNYRSRLTAYNVLGRICRTKALWCVVGITERFDRTVEADLARGLADSPVALDDAKWFLRSWARGALQIFEPPNIDARLAQDLAKRVASLYREAHGSPDPDQDMIRSCVAEWTRNPSRNPRRLIRLLIHHLDIRRAL